MCVEEETLTYPAVETIVVPVEDLATDDVDEAGRKILL